MAPAATATAILVLLDGTVFSTDVIALTFEVSLMTPRAEGCVARRRIRYVFVVVRVTRTTANVRPMIAGIVAVVWMRVIDRRPTLRGMTGVTFRNGHKVIVWALGGTTNCGGAVMARGATIGNTLMIKGATHKGCGGVTERAIKSS